MGMTEFLKKLTTTLLMLVLAAGTSGGSCSEDADDNDHGTAGEWDPSDKSVTMDEVEEAYLSMCTTTCPVWIQCDPFILSNPDYYDYYYYDDEAPPQTTEECIAECEEDWTDDYDEYLSSGEYDGLLPCLMGEWALDSCFARALMNNDCDYDAAYDTCDETAEALEACFIDYYEDYYDDYYGDDYYINEPDIY